MLKLSKNPITQLDLYLEDIKPVSINRAYYRNGSLTTESRFYRDRFHCLLNKYFQEITNFNTEIADIKNPHIALNINIETPAHLLFKKDSLIYSNLAGDMNNYTKLIEDFLFQFRYRGRLTTAGTPYHILHLDDRFVKEGSSKQEPSPTDTWNIRLYITAYSLEAL